MAVLLVLALFWGTADNCSPTLINIERDYTINEEGYLYMYDVEVYLNYQSPADKYLW